MVGQAPHVEFQFHINIRTIPDMAFLLRHHRQEVLPRFMVQHQFLRGFQHPPAHGLAVVLVDTLLLEEADDVLIYPLFVTLRLFVQIVHHTPSLLAVMVERTVYIRHLMGKITQTDYQMEILTVSDTLRAL